MCTKSLFFVVPLHRVRCCTLLLCGALRCAGRLLISLVPTFAAPLFYHTEFSVECGVVFLLLFLVSARSFRKCPAASGGILCCLCCGLFLNALDQTVFVCVRTIDVSVTLRRALSPSTFRSFFHPYLCNICHSSV